MSNLDRDTDECWICQSHGECKHREEGLRGYRTMAAFIRRKVYLAESGRAEGKTVVESIAQPIAVPTYRPAERTRTEAYTGEKALDLEYPGLRGW